MPVAQVNVGLIGLGSWWDMRFRPVLQSLESKLKVVAVCDNVLSKADQAARDLKAKSVAGISTLVNRPDIQALLVLDAGWQAGSLLPFVCELRKPVLWAARSFLSSAELLTLHQRANAIGQTVMPMFLNRYTPSSNRLQELLATQLGRPRRIEVLVSQASRQAVPFATSRDLAGPNEPPLDPLLEWTDWCCYLLRESLAERAVQSDGQRVSLRFSSASKSADPNFHTADISFRTDRLDTSELLPDVVLVTCDHGSARLTSPTAIEWTIDGTTHSESLTTERSETEVVLDHFCRRVIGGLIPVPDLTDLCRAQG